ncbi:MAG: hypothetical protein ACRD8K_03165 [Nitrososphaeraceae archaeon]
MLYNKISIIMLAATTTIFLVSIILSMSTFINISAFAQSEGTNQTIQDAAQSANQTGEAIKQNVSDVITNISQGAKSLGSNITTEVANEIADNIGKKLQDLAK